MRKNYTNNNDNNKISEKDKENKDFKFPKIIKSMNLIDYPIEENEEEAFLHKAFGIKNFDTTKVIYFFTFLFFFFSLLE